MTSFTMGASVVNKPCVISRQARMTRVTTRIYNVLRYRERNDAQTARASAIQTWKRIHTILGCDWSISQHSLNIYTLGISLSVIAWFKCPKMSVNST